MFNLHHVEFNCLLESCMFWFVVFVFCICFYFTGSLYSRTMTCHHNRHMWAYQMKKTTLTMPLIVSKTHHTITIKLNCQKTEYKKTARRSQEMGLQNKNQFPKKHKDVVKFKIILQQHYIVAWLAWDS